MYCRTLTLEKAIELERAARSPKDPQAIAEFSSLLVQGHLEPNIAKRGLPAPCCYTADRAK